MRVRRRVAKWIDRDRLLVATESGLVTLDLVTRDRRRVAPLRTEGLRTNDGRADPWGGFWFSTMGKRGEHGAGAITRYFRGDLRRLHGDLTIPNAICFGDGCAYFADTAQRRVWRQGLDAATGWPDGEASVFLALATEGLNPDGAVTDAAGRLWIAQWGAGRVTCHSPDGRYLGAETFAASQLSCPAFGGPDLDVLHVTPAWQGMDGPARAGEPHGGMTLARRVGARGRAEPPVSLGSQVWGDVRPH